MRRANSAMIARTPIIHILGHYNFKVECYGKLVGVHVEELEYDTVRNKLVG